MSNGSAVDPREPEQPNAESIARAKRIGAKEAIQAICDSCLDGFQVLLHRDRLREFYSDRELNDAFDQILDERRRK